MTFFIPEEKVLEIQNAADIIDIVSESVLLKRAGKNHVGLCPFHSEKTPSFTVNPEKQIFYCFGCTAGGNVFSFLMKHEGISFPEAARALARRYGIELPTGNISAAQKRVMSEREQILVANKHAVDCFSHALLSDSAGRKGLKYLSERGITGNTLERFGIGYAPEGWSNLMHHLARKGVLERLLEKSGLVIENKQKNVFYDRFRNRIMFPIFNTGDQVIGFGGRVLDDSLPKYLNSPETPVYNKSRSLYGLNVTKQKCREKGLAFIVEGYMDLLALWQNGIENVVATLGTSLTAEHVRLLKGYAEKVILVYDSDDAGLKAAARSISIFDSGHLDSMILVLPEGYDPDSYVFEFGAEAFIKIAEKAIGSVDFLMESAIKKYGLSVEGKVRIVSAMNEHLAEIQDSVARSLYIKKMAEKLGIDDSAIMEKVRRAMNTKRSGSNAESLLRRESGVSGKRHKTWNGSATPTESYPMEKKIIAMMLQFPQVLSEIRRQEILSLFENGGLKKIGISILEHKGDSSRMVSDLIATIDIPQERQLVASLAIEEDMWGNEGCLKLINQFTDSRKRKQSDLLMKIKKAEAQNDQELLNELLMQRLKDRKKIRNKLKSAGGEAL
ncbi:MAG: DNA primase [Deltaproteobacteria bacterium]|nr:DNA primase [Deltaproteobacteria bacterium]